MRLILTAFAALGFRGWLTRPWQMTLRGYGLIVALCAVALIVARFPAPMIVFVAGMTVALLAVRALPRHGFRLADVAALLAIILLAAGLLLPEMVRIREWTAGGRFFPRIVPARFMALVQGEQIRPPF